MEDKVNILMAEGHTPYHMIYEGTLTDAIDWNVSFSPIEKEALIKLESKDFDLIILDYNLPDIPSEELLTKIREEVVRSNLPLIFLTAESNSDLQSRPLVLGANAFIEKGSTPEIIKARVTV